VINELRAVTPAGERLVALAEEHAADFATRAAQHDRENTFVAENFDAMKRTRFLAACVPEEFGGLGVSSIHDVMVAVSRLARGCASTAIAANMHVTAVIFVVSAWRQAKTAGNEPAITALTEELAAIGRCEMILSGAGTEPGNETWATRSTATPVEGGYVVNGRKGFSTGIEVADSVRTRLRIPRSDGPDEMAFVTVPRGAKGMEILYNWDALGMRGSGSHDVVFTDCFVPEGAVQVLAPIGPPPAFAWPPISSNIIPLFGANLGIAEAAREYIVEFVKTRRRRPYTSPLAERAHVQREIAEIDVGLMAMRSVLSRVALRVDQLIAAAEMREDVLNAFAHDVQCAKLVSDRAAVDVVDRALAVSGGSGYLSSSLLSRLYRDVRAGAFMQPYSPNEAYEFIGRISLGIDPYTELRAAIAAEDGR
jgi:alkylation response protein AidB-like acyl-CoA dehydrogenase